jgi:5-carboxyvanillate decarboxylase
MKIIAVEEHFTTKESTVHFRPPIPVVSTKKTAKMATCKGESLDHIEARLKDMDDAGIERHLLSLGPSVEQYEASLGTSIARAVNERVIEVVKKYPKRFAGLATIASQDPESAADELERVVKLGLKGAMIKSHVNGEYLDEKKYWVIFERAAKLGVPIYLHPKEPSPGMIQPYLKYPQLTGAMWGYGAETGLHAMRLICSGLFDKYPELKIILGHLGEAIPFWLWRIDAKGNIDNLAKKPSEYFRDNFYVTTSGMFWHPAIQLVHSALGVDRILFAVDYPMESSEYAVQCIKTLHVSETDRKKIFYRNAEAVFKL